ncbi:MAG: sigma-70 family RNA polymerase sigma factor [Bacillota bacterium]
MFFLIFTDNKSESKYCRMYSLHEHVMIKLAMNILKDQKHSEDVVQECFLEMLENEKLLQRLGEPDSPATKSYLMMMVKSRAINLYRKIKKQNIVMDDDENLLYMAEDESADVETILANAEILIEIREYLSILDPMDINIMTLKYYKGFQNTEIAEILAIDSSLVGVRLFRAKKKLAAEVQKRKNQKGAAERG